ncbi:recombinase family protein [Variovorax guangxiensis]|uniref:Recombinase family protein n=1 Tax=Variovorax guangxiensis TaxID=1775474 RepID=A0A502DV57_9BURK|nr:recombinase family protein [Variovorax guangxiensis]TPG24961.1 recombinase family protein [Variovorax ginsengisoli]TPG29213.1 recombinase family protein [Variovorax guangxiensis]
MDKTPSANVHLPILAAEYVRMSTEHQQYSTHNQVDRIREYAAQRGIEVVRTYADEGKSGLRIAGRLALQRLILDVESGEANFSLVLVYDVSRWGRFQDADESAYYEYICKRAGIQVVYCAEQFENDGSPVSTIVKGVKRAMAGEYSRELSAKVFAGQCRLIERGFRQGGPAGFGLRRLLIDQSGAPKGELSRGEQKSLQTDRVVLVPGPEPEVTLVRQIYKWFVSDGLTETSIAARLNTSGISGEHERKWSRATVHEVLINEKYVGSNVYNRVSFKLRKLRVVNPSDMWIRKEDAFPPLVGKEEFYTAQGIIRARSRRFSDSELIERLRLLYQDRQALSGLLINSTDGMPSSSVYAHRFGSLVRAYRLVGYSPSRDFQYIEINRVLRRLHPTIVKETEEKMDALGGKVRREPHTELLRVNEEFSVSVVLARCHRRESGQLFWKVRLDTGLEPDLTVAVRLAPENQVALDYYLLPRLDISVPRINLGERNPVELENFRFENLEYLYGMAARTRLRRAA